MLSYRKNDLLPLRVEDVTNLGYGVARTGEGVAVLIAGALPGDEVLCRVIKVTSRYLIGRVEELRAPSPHRVVPICPAAGKCGGCQFLALDYREELARKEAFVREALRKEGLAIEVKPILTTGARTGYRNKVVYPIAPRGQKNSREAHAALDNPRGLAASSARARLSSPPSKNISADRLLPLPGAPEDTPRSGVLPPHAAERESPCGAGDYSQGGGVLTGEPPPGFALGYFAPHSHRVIESGVPCPLHHPALERPLALVRQYLRESGAPPYDEASGQGLMRHVVLRTNHAGSEISLCLVATGSLPREELLLRLLRRDPAVKSVSLNIHKERTNVIFGKESRLLGGSPTIEDELCGASLSISPRSFYQVNHDAAQLLYREAARLACLSPGERLLDLYCGIGSIGICLARQTPGVALTGVELLPEAAALARENAARNRVSAEFFCDDAGAFSLPPADVIVLDPPRSGLSPDLLDRLAASPARAVVMISCAPNTLARDLRALAARGLVARELTPVDMFPATGHVECVTALRRE